MCISTTVSYSASVVLISTGAYAALQTWQLPRPYLLWSMVPVFFGIQQAFEGGVWQALDTVGLYSDSAMSVNFGTALSCALGFHFFSHFLWLWWLPLCSYLVEPGKIRKRVFAGCAMFGAFSGALVYGVMLINPEWMSITVREHSIVYDFIAPWHSTVHLPVTPVMLYGLTILVPLLLSSHRPIMTFGILAILSMALASEINNRAFVSVWCFFAAVLSLYLVFMLRHFARQGHSRHEGTTH